MPSSAQNLLDYALKCSAQAKVPFENAQSYNAELSHTYLRTIGDLYPLKGPLNVLEIGSFTAVVSLALRKMGHPVTASDMPFILNDPALRQLLHDNSIDTIPANLAETPFPAAD